MKALLLVVGKTSEKWLNDGIGDYSTRINRYIPFEMLVIADMKNRGKIDNETLKKQEGEKILSSILEKDVVVLLDENGKHFSSVAFAIWIERDFLITSRRIVCVIGGAYGFSREVYERANFKISLSAMTFSHQMVRLIFVEQLYRAFTIINKEPYHHV
jgi:23S rRNA (pseudouridine1915-N3)-methyltransferase